MSRKENCYDSAMDETFFKTPKSARVWRTVFDTRAKATRTIDGYFDGSHNPTRRHSVLDFSGPMKHETTVTG